MRLDRIRSKTLVKYQYAEKLVKGGCEPRIAAQRAGLSLNWFEKIQKEKEKAHNDFQET